eukprot:SAG22_NODE_1811_length_3525_cov_12.037653_1_plen_157_part_00
MLWQYYAFLIGAHRCCRANTCKVEASLGDKVTNSTCSDPGTVRTDRLRVGLGKARLGKWFTRSTGVTRHCTAAPTVNSCLVSVSQHVITGWAGSARYRARFGCREAVHCRTKHSCGLCHHFSRYHSSINCARDTPGALGPCCILPTALSLYPSPSG